MWIIKFTKNAEKDKKLLKSAELEDKVKKLLNLIGSKAGLFIYSMCLTLCHL